MIYCFNFNFWQEIESSDLLTYAALVVAYLAYSYSVNRDLESWRSLLVSLKSDLKSQSSWIGGSGYSQETYNDKKSFSPLKVIYPLSFESSVEIIRRGAEELPGVSEKFIDNLSIFNERIIAFNSALDHIKLVVSSSPIMSEKLNKRLDDLGMRKIEEEISFDYFQKEIRKLKKTERIFHLAENIRRLHRVVHVEIIGNSNKGDNLNYLYHEIVKELENILDNFEKRKPTFIRYKKEFLILSLLIFFIIEIFLK